MAHSPAPWITRHDDSWDGYSYEFDDRTGDFIGCAKRPDDAALIAAAPDLLEACKEVVAHICEVDDDGTTPNYHLIQMVKKAIAKAEGAT